MNAWEETYDVAVIGGGLAGLTAAIHIARAGARVIVLERASQVGGRAATHVDQGFHLNLGPHAVYNGGRMRAVLSSLGVTLHGGVPAVAGSYAWHAGRMQTLPGGFLSLLSTGLFGLGAKLETARVLSSIGRVDAAAFDSVSVEEWVCSTARDETVRQLLHALIRVSTYSHAPHEASAGAALRQLQMALDGNVTYLDGGWGTVVDALVALAERVGVRIVGNARVGAIVHERAVRAVKLADGRTLDVAQAIVAGSPALAHALVPRSRALERFHAAATPVRAACLDVTLTALPRAKSRFALGIDRPLYASVHSAVARLAPAGSAMIHLAKYLASDERDDHATIERELETLLDRLQPGWREVVAARRFLPSMIVSNALVTAAAGGASGRPAPGVPDVEGLYVIGDWVGDEGMLADASFASAVKGAELVVARWQRRKRGPTDVALGAAR